MATKKTLKAKDIERLENTTSVAAPGSVTFDCLTTATTFCCPTERYSICDAIVVRPLPTLDCLTTATTFCCPTYGSICEPQG